MYVGSKAAPGRISLTILSPRAARKTRQKILVKKRQQKGESKATQTPITQEKHLDLNRHVQ